MCGLIGIASTGQTKIDPTLVPFMFNYLMGVNDSRGGDSYGFMFVDPENKTQTPYKVLGEHVQTANGNRPWNKGLKRIFDAIKENRPFAVIGHNRKATTGAVTVRNQHPFQFGKLDTDKWIIGAHNGMLSQHDDIAKELEIKNHYEVDSEIIFRAMMLSDKPLDILGELEPMCMMSLSYMQNDFDKVQLYRGTNPLSITKKNGLLFWNSELTPLKRITNGVRMESQELAYNTCHTFDIGTGELIHNNLGVRSSNKLKFAIPSKWEYTHPYGDYYTRREEGHTYYPSGGGPSATSRIIPSSKHMSRKDKKKYHKRQSLYEDLFNGAVGEDRELFDLDTVPEQGQSLSSCSVCRLTNASDATQKLANSETFLWYEDQAFCGICYYFMVQVEAEKAIMEKRKIANRESRS